jgi:hypothetical protein
MYVLAIAHNMSYWRWSLLVASHLNSFAYVSHSHFECNGAGMTKPYDGDSLHSFQRRPTIGEILINKMCKYFYH